jgi:hypothetical protein
MNTIGLRDLDLLKVGGEIQLVGGLWQGEGKTYLSLIKGEEVEDTELVVLKMDVPDWERFLRQTDLLEAEILQNDGTGIKKAIVRKTQRQVDGLLQWNRWKADNFHCRYCDRNDIQLTVDHIILWEEMGETCMDNLLSACKKCNQTRGNMQYEDWLKSEEYKKVSVNLPDEIRKANEDLVVQLPHLRTLKVQHIRSR